MSAGNTIEMHLDSKEEKYSWVYNVDKYQQRMSQVSLVDI